MQQPENVKAVKRIAEELMLRRQLHPDHVMRLLELSDGELTESEYQQLVSLFEDGATATRRRIPKATFLRELRNAPRNSAALVICR